MVEGRAQSSHAEKLLTKLEPLIRNGVPIDIPQAVNKHLEKYEKMAPDERERTLRRWIEAAHGRNRYFKSHMAWAVLKELSERILDRDEIPPRRLAQFAMEVQTGRIQEKRARGRPSRSIAAKMLIVAAQNLLIESKGYTVGQAQERIAGWMYTKPNAVAQIISDWKPLVTKLSSEKRAVF